MQRVTILSIMTVVGCGSGVGPRRVKSVVTIKVVMSIIPTALLTCATLVFSKVTRLKELRQIYSKCVVSKCSKLNDTTLS